MKHSNEEYTHHNYDYYLRILETYGKVEIENHPNINTKMGASGCVRARLYNRFNCCTYTEIGGDQEVVIRNLYRILARSLVNYVKLFEKL